MFQTWLIQICPSDRPGAQGNAKSPAKCGVLAFTFLKPGNRSQMMHVPVIGERQPDVQIDQRGETSTSPKFRHQLLPLCFC